MAKKVKKSTAKKFESKLKGLSKQEMKEIILINTYKMALIRSQLEVITDILVKNKLATREQIWKKTEENFEDSTI